MSNREPSGAAIGWIAFAGFILILGGSFMMLAGLGGIINPDAYVIGKDNILKLSTTSWGWWHLILGAVVFLSGLGVFAGNILARTVGVIVALISAISAFVWIPIYPVWGIIIIAMDFAVIWALTAHGRDVQKAERMDQM